MPGIIKKGETKKRAAVRKLLKSIDQCVSSDQRDDAMNLKYPLLMRELISDSEGVTEALELLSNRCLNMLTGETV